MRTNPPDQNAVWPFTRLCVRLDHLELRLPDFSELTDLALLAKKGVHAPDAMPFPFPWTAQEPQHVARSVMQYFWRTQGAITPESWEMSLTLFDGEQVVGTSGLSAQEFALHHTIETGSWIGREFQGRGIGTKMRIMCLALAFDHLGAAQVTSGAFCDNAASNRVSQKLGYRDNGYELLTRQGQSARLNRFVLTAEDWESRPERLRAEVKVSGLDACLPLLGIANG